MPKKVKKILIPTKGMNNFADSRDLPFSHFEELRSAEVNVPGKLRPGGRFYPGPQSNTHGDTGEDDELPSMLATGNGGVSSKYGTYKAQISEVASTVSVDDVSLEVMGKGFHSYNTGDYMSAGVYKGMYDIQGTGNSSGSLYPRGFPYTTFQPFAHNNNTEVKAKVRMLWNLGSSETMNYGSNVITNGTGDSLTDWTTTTNWLVSGGLFRDAAFASELSRTVSQANDPNKYWKLTFDWTLSGLAAKTLSISFGGTLLETISEADSGETSGSAEYHIQGNAANQLLKFEGNTVGGGFSYLDNIEMVEIKMDTTESGQWGLMVDGTDAFSLGMVGGHVRVLGPHGTIDNGTNSDTWYDNSAQITRVDGPQQVVLSNKIKCDVGDYIFVDWSPTYNEMRGQNYYKIRITHVNATDKKVCFKVARNNRSYYSADYAYKMNAYDWVAPWSRQNHNQIASGEQSLRDARIKGIQIHGNRNMSISSGNVDSEIVQSKYSDWYKIDYGVYIRWKNISAANFDDKLQVGDTWFFSTNAPINLNEYAGPYDQARRAIGGKINVVNYDRKKLNIDSGPNFKSDSYGGRLLEFRGNKTFTLEDGKNHNQIALENKGDVYTYSAMAKTITIGNTSIEQPHGWIHLGKCIYENQRVEIVPMLEEDQTASTTYTASFKYFKCNRQSLRLVFVKPDGTEYVLYPNYGRTSSALSSKNLTRYGEQYGVEWKKNDLEAACSFVLNDTGALSGSTEKDILDKSYGSSFNANTGKLTIKTGANSYWPKGTTVYALCDSELQPTTEQSSLNYLNGKLRVASNVYPFNGKTWYVGKNKGLLPSVKADFSAMAMTYYKYNNVNEEISTNEPAYYRDMSQVWRQGPCNETKQVTQWSEYGVWERPVVIPSPHDCVDGGGHFALASIPNEWGGFIGIHYGYAQQMTTNPGGTPYIFPMYGRGTTASGYTSTGQAYPQVMDTYGMGFDDSGRHFPSFFQAQWSASHGDNNDSSEVAYVKRYIWNCKQSMVFHKSNVNWMHSANKAAERGNPYVMVIFPSWVEETDTLVIGADTQMKRYGMGWNTAVSDVINGQSGTSASGDHEAYLLDPASNVTNQTNTETGLVQTSDEGEHTDVMHNKVIKAHYVRIKRVMPSTGFYTFDTTQASNNLYMAGQTWYGVYPYSDDYDSYAKDEGDDETPEFNLKEPSGISGFTIIVPYKEDMYNSAGNKRLFIGRTDQMGTGNGASYTIGYQYKILPPRGGCVLIQHHGLGSTNQNSAQWFGKQFGNWNGTEGVKDFTAEKLAPTSYWKDENSYEFGISYSDEDENESEITWSIYTRVYLNDARIWRPGLTLHGPFPGWVRKIRVYIRLAGATDSAWALFMESNLATVQGYKEADWKLGQTLYTIPHKIYHRGKLAYEGCGYNSDSQEYSSLNLDMREHYNNEMAFTNWGIEIEKMQALTYKLLNGFAPSDDARIKGYKHSALINGIFVVAGIRYGTSQNDDSLYWSPKFKKPRYDNLHLDSAIVLDTQDGDMITDLKSFKGTLLVFKKASIEVVSFKDVRNVYTAEKLKQGIDNKNGAVETDFGVFWANKQGVWMYGEQGLKNISMGKLNNIWIKDYMESNLDSMSYKSQASPYSLAFYNRLTQDVIFINDGAYQRSGGKSLLVYNILMAAFTWHPKGFENDYWLGDRKSINQGSGNAEDFDNINTADSFLTNLNRRKDGNNAALSNLLHQHTREFYGGSVRHYWHNDSFSVHGHLLESNTGEFRVLTDNVYDSAGINFNALQEITGIGTFIAGQTYTATSDTFAVSGYIGNWTDSLMVGDYFVIRNSSSPNLPTAVLTTTGNSEGSSEEIFQVTSIYANSTIQVRRGMFGSTPKAFDTNGGGTDIPNAKIYKLQRYPVSGQIMTYDTSNRMKVGGRDLLWSTPDMHMAADYEATAQGQRGEATKKRFYKLVVTYKNGKAKRHDDTVDSNVRVYFAVDGQDMVYDEDHEMVTKDGVSAFCEEAEAWVTQELYPKNKTLCKNSYSIKYHFVSKVNSHHQNLLQDSFGEPISRYTQVGNKDLDLYHQILRGGTFYKNNEEDVDPSTASNLDLLTYSAHLMKTSDTYVAWETNTLHNAAAGEKAVHLYEVGYPNGEWPSATLLLQNSSAGGRPYVRAEMSSNTASTSYARARIPMKRGLTYRVEVWFTKDHDNAIINSKTDANKKFPYNTIQSYGGIYANGTSDSVPTIGGWNNTGTAVSRTAGEADTAAAHESTLQSRCVPGQIVFSDSTDIGTVAGDNQAKYNFHETGKYHFYFTYQKSNKTTDQGLYLYLTTKTSHPYGYCIFNKISIREVRNWVAGEFEINDMTQIYREKTVK